MYDQTIAISNLTPDMVATYLQNKSLSAAARRRLQQIADKKREIADNDAATRRASDVRDLTQDEERMRQNLNSLRQVSGQQDQVQQYARQRAASETG